MMTVEKLDKKWFASPEAFDKCIEEAVKGLIVRHKARLAAESVNRDLGSSEIEKTLSSSKKFHDTTGM